MASDRSSHASRLLLCLLTALALSAALLPAATVAAQARPCHPFTTEPRLRGTVPTASEAIGVELGSRDVTTAESDAYLQAVDDASTRVITGTAGHSQQGRPLRYAIVGRSRNVTRAGLASIREDVRAARADHIARPEGAYRPSQSRHPVDRQQRPWWRGERHRRVAAGAV